MKKEHAKAAYPSGALVKPGDLVTGSIGVGCFPAEPFLAQVVFVAPGLEKAEVVFLKRPEPLNAAASLFRRQSRVAETYIEAMVPTCTLSLHQRCSRPQSRHAAEKIARAASGQDHNSHGAEWASAPAPNAG
jgi:hypothetical protein